MAMYYQGSSEIQADGLQTLYLLNPNYVGYSDTQFMNSAAVHAPNSAPVPHAPPAQQFVGIPLSHDPSRPSPALPQQEHIQAAHNTIPRFHYNNNSLWNLFDQSGNGNQPNMPQGLSLSLSQHQSSGFDHKSLPSDHHDFQAGLGLISPKISSSSPSNGANSMQISVIMGSKYLEAAQQLLDEVANVGKESRIDRPQRSKDKAKIIEKSKGEASSGNNGGGAELTTPQRQEIQMKKAKLISMLDEVEQRYKQYHHQMQIIVASFEQAAGIGSAKSYTQLALNTILKQFKCLKSSISAQIKALSKALGEDDQSLVEKFEGSRLKFVDHQLRQHKAMQQLGMMQNNAWRPQRGLPERAVSVLRAWLFEHFLHPYPKDSDKHMLAKQTGLTRSQVSNWFINARVRLWKPMVEEMYLEEIKNQEQISPDKNELNSKKNNITLPIVTINDHLHLQSKQDNLILNLDPSPTEISPSTITNSPSGSSLQARSSFAQFISSINMENLSEKNPKKPRNDHNSPSSILSAEMETEAGNASKGLHTRENYLSMAAQNTCTPGPGIGFGTFGIREFSRFNGDQQISPGNFPGNNNFSLTLALPPSETSQRTHHQQNFFSHRNFDFETRIENGAVESSKIGNGIENDSHPNIGYEIIDFQNRKQFPAQRLPDFVA